MDWILPTRVPLLASGIAMLLLAAVLVAIDFEKRVNRAFAAILALRGVTIALQVVNMPPDVGLALTMFVPYLILPVVPLALYFASIYPRRRGPLGRPGGGWIAVGVAVALDLLYLLWHDGYYAAEVGTTSVDILVARPGVAFTGFGPLVAVGMLYPLVLSTLSLVFALDYIRSSPGTQRTSFFLMAAGFLLNGLFDGVRPVAGLVALLQDPAGFPWLPWGWAVALLPAFSLLPAVAALALVARHHFRERRAAERRMEARLHVAAVLAVGSGLAPFLLADGGAAFLSDQTVPVLLGAWRLCLPGLVTFALLRYALFDIDIRVRAAVAWGVVAGLFAFGWFIGSNLLQNVIAEGTGTGIVGGLVAAAGLTLATKPMVKLGHWAAAKLMPGVHDFSKKTRDASALYREQFLMLQEDGVVTRKERRCLERLRAKLELPKAIADDIEARVLKAPAQPGRPRARAA